MNNWKEFYTLPLKLDEDEDGSLYDYYAWSEQNNMALTFEYTVTEKEVKEITKVINGSQINISKEAKGGWTNKEVDFFYKGEHKFCVRGWGGLTGGIGLTHKKAIKIQNQFIKYILKVLNNE